MNKAELLNWLQEENRRWHNLLDQVGPARMEQPEVVAHWSMKDIVAHLTGWNRGMLARFRAAQRGEPEPPPLWRTDLHTDDEINAWIYEAYRDRSLREVLDESEQVFQHILAVTKALPDDVQIETVRGPSGRDYYLVWLGDKRYQPGEFFDHLRDDHEADIRAWVGRAEKSS